MNPYELGALKTHSTLHQIGVAEDTIIDPYVKRVQIAANAGAITVTAPDATLTPGHTLVVEVPDVADGGTTTVATLTGIRGNDLTLDADNDYVLLYSDGVEWFTLVDGIA